MSKNFSKLMTILLASVGSSFFIEAAVGQAVPIDETTTQSETVIESIPDAFNRTFFENTGDFFFQTSIENQVLKFFGVNYLDNLITEDAEAVNNLFNSTLRQQLEGDQAIRTRDLENPFDTSIRDNPSYIRIEGLPR